MLMTIAIVLGLMWLLGFGFQVGGSLIHLILVIALIALVYDVVTRRRAI